MHDDNVCDDCGYCQCGCGECNCDNFDSFESKKPKDMRRHVGVEIEFFSRFSQYELATKLDNNGLSKYCQIKEDCSLEHDDLEGHELNILCLETDYKVILKKVCVFLQSVGAEVNRTCGLHIHLDMRKRNKEHVFYNLVQCQDILFAMQPRSRRRNSYCPKIETHDFNHATRNYNRGAINATAYGRHRTIEIRLHTGSVNYVKITNWIAILLKIVGKKIKIAETVDKPVKLARYVRLPKVLRQYIDSRVELFNSEDQQNAA